MKIIFYGPDPARTQQWADCLAQQGLVFDAHLWQENSPAHLATADYAVVWLPPEGFFTAVTGLKAVFNVGAGVDAILKLRSLPDDLDVVRLDDREIGSKMREYVLHAVAEITRQMQAYRHDNAQGLWNPGPYANFEDWPVGVMGLGKIGLQIAHALADLGYPVSGWSRSARQHDPIACFHGRKQLDHFLGHSRIVINVLPLTPETEGILNAHAFRQMPADSFIINIGRGEHVDEQALLASVQQGNLSGAVLDVFLEEPLPVHHPFWNEPKIRITPHISGQTNLVMAMRQIAQKIRAHQDGQPMSGVVNKQVGY